MNIVFISNDNILLDCWYPQCPYSPRWRVKDLSNFSQIIREQIVHLGVNKNWLMRCPSRSPPKSVPLCQRIEAIEC